MSHPASSISRIVFSSQHALPCRNSTKAVQSTCQLVTASKHGVQSAMSTVRTGTTWRCTQKTLSKCQKHRTMVQMIRVLRACCTGVVKIARLVFVVRRHRVPQAATGLPDGVTRTALDDLEFRVSPAFPCFSCEMMGSLSATPPSRPVTVMTLTSLTSASEISPNLFRAFSASSLVLMLRESSLMPAIPKEAFA
jgi:hypothetical protein